MSTPKKNPRIDALIFDLDGTAFPSGKEKFLSARVIRSIELARKKVVVTFATGRDLEYSNYCIKKLNLDRPVIICGGTQLYDVRTKKVVWEGLLKPETVHQIYHLLEPFTGYEIYTNSAKFNETQDIHSSKQLDNVNVFYVIAVPEIVMKKILNSLKVVEGIRVPIFPSWKSGKWDIHITDELATKKHALQVFLARERINHNQAMVVGDGENDLPLFELAGLKVAMGNAVPELKKAADWIAPIVEDDGLAVAIEKFILHPNQK